MNDKCIACIVVIFAERVAIKILDKTKLTAKAKKMLSREISVMESVHHQNIIRYVNITTRHTRVDFCSCLCDYE